MNLGYCEAQARAMQFNKNKPNKGVKLGVGNQNRERATIAETKQGSLPDFCFVLFLYPFCAHPGPLSFWAFGGS